jgi:hypothetical protein
VRHTRSASGGIRKVSVAVIVNERPAPPPADGAAVDPKAPKSLPYTPQELEQMQQVVRGVVGFDQTRGDNVSVVPARFEAPAPLETIPWYLENKVQSGLTSALIAISFIVFMLIVVRPIMRNITMAKAQAEEEKAKAAMNQAIADANKAPLARLFSVKHEFPTPWHQFLHSAGATASLTVTIDLERFPFQFRGKTIEIKKVELFLPLKDGMKPGTAQTYTQIYTASPLTLSITSPSGTASGKLLNSTPSFLNGIPHVAIEASAVPIQVKSGDAAAWSFTVDSAKLKPLQEAIDDFFIVCHYSVR